MKKYFSFLVLLTAFAACDKAEQFEIDDPAPATSSDIVFKASIEEPQLTKTTLSNDGEGGYNILWAATDRIGIKCPSRYSMYRPSEEAATSSLIYVTGLDGGVTGYPVEAYYPSTLYTKEAGVASLPIERSVTNGVLTEFPMYAYSSDENLSFKNLCGVLRLQLSGTGDAQIGTIVISADEALSGVFTPEADGGAYKAVATGLNKLTVNLSGSARTISEGCDLWLPVPAGSYTNLAIKVYKSDNTSYSLKTAKSAIVVQRSRITTINLTSLTLDTPVASLSGSGTEDDPYTLMNEADIDLLRELIDIGTSFSGKYFEVLNDITITKPHTPLGPLTCNTFNGGDRVITLSGGFDMSSNPAHAGFFSEFSGNLIDMNIAGPDVTLSAYETTNIEAFGVLIGYWGTKSGTVSGCHNSINISVTTSNSSGPLYVGGLLGLHYGTLENCHNSGNITVTSTVLRSYDSCVGGIVGRSGGIITASNSGNITANRIRYCGGISGHVTSAGNGYYVDKCNNTGNIVSSTPTGNSQADNRVRAGGISGYHNLYFRNCYNTGNVTAYGPEVYYPGSIAGGIAGEVGGSGSTITNCYNLGDITAKVGQQFTDDVDYTCKPLAGGISGLNGTATNCYSTGALITMRSSRTGSGWSYGRCEGGIISMISHSGISYKGSMEYCYYPDATLDESSYVLRGVGFKTASKANDYYVNGTSTTYGADGTNSSAFNASTLVTGGAKSAAVTINEVEYPVGTSILTLLNAEREVLGTSTYLPWKAGTGDPAYPVFDE